MTRQEAALCRFWGFPVRGFGGGRWEVKQGERRGWLCRLFFSGWWHHADCHSNNTRTI